MKNLERLRNLRPWDNVSEEDLFRVGELYLQIRGNLKRPNGVWCTIDRQRASNWVLEPQLPPALEDFRLNADTGEVHGGKLDLTAVEGALDQVLDQFEGKSAPQVEFPIAFNY